MKSIKKVVTVSGATLFAWLVAGVASAQTTTTDVLTSTSTPGVPNTGAGGDLLMNLFLLAIAGAVVIAGMAYLSHKWSTNA